MKPEQQRNFDAWIAEHEALTFENNPRKTWALLTEEVRHVLRWRAGCYWLDHLQSFKTPKGLIIVSQVYKNTFTEDELKGIPCNLRGLWYDRKHPLRRMLARAPTDHTDRVPCCANALDSGGGSEAYYVNYVPRMCREWI